MFKNLTKNYIEKVDKIPLKYCIILNTIQNHIILKFDENIIIKMSFKT